MRAGVGANPSVPLGELQDVLGTQAIHRWPISRVVQASA
jgi:hypothetical protein